MSDMLSGNQGIDQWAEMSRRNLELFQSSLGMFNPQASTENGKGPRQEPPPEPSSEPSPETEQETELETLRQQMAEMQKQLNALSR